MTAMTREHDTIAATLASLHKLTNDFSVPEDAGNAQRCLYRELKELEEGLRRHMLIEDEILFPRALEMEKSLRESRQRKTPRPLRGDATR
jgi:regulator of cell morphogenesis and NO signaling